ncbi:hypothetical protein WMF38_38830 [Sorangium sp. So ce118]
MRSRHSITLRAPRVVRPGETFDVRLALDSATETPIQFVRVTLQYTHAVWVHSSREGRAPFTSRDLVLLSEDVAGQGRLGAGVHHYQVSFALPDDVPPSHVGVVADIRCKVSALVSIPWWLDAEEHQELLVRPAIAQAPKDEPFTGASPRGDGAFVEVSLPGRPLTPGELLAGAVAFGGLVGRRPFTLDVAVIGVERALARGRRLSQKIHRFSFFQDIARVAEGAEVPFRIALPDDLAPSFSFAEVSLEYALEVVLDHPGGRVLHCVPLIVDVFAPRTARQGRWPRVGADRWRAVWAGAGQRAGLSLGQRRLRLRGVRAGCAVGA